MSLERLVTGPEIDSVSHSSEMGGHTQVGTVRRVIIMVTGSVAMTEMLLVPRTLHDGYIMMDHFFRHWVSRRWHIFQLGHLVGIEWLLLVLDQWHLGLILLHPVTHTQASEDVVSRVRDATHEAIACAHSRLADWMTGWLCYPSSFGVYSPIFQFLYACVHCQISM